MSLFSRLMPFISVGIFLVFLFGAIILSFYVLLYGALIGLVLFLFTWIRSFFKKEQHTRTNHEHIGKIYDQE